MVVFIKSDIIDDRGAMLLLLLLLRNVPGRSMWVSLLEASPA